VSERLVNCDAGRVVSRWGVPCFVSRAGAWGRPGDALTAARKLAAPIVRIRDVATGEEWYVPTGAQP